MPQFMIKSIIVSMLKNKCGTVNNKKNYRPIALPSITSKLFKHIILLMLEEYLWTTGFKLAHLKDLCISDVIEYILSRFTSIYVAFTDASKAFDQK